MPPGSPFGEAQRFGCPDQVRARRTRTLEIRPGRPHCAAQV